MFMSNGYRLSLTMNKVLIPRFLLFILFSFSSCCDSKNIPNYINGLRSSTPKVRNDSALELASCGSPEADKAVPLLIKLLYDENIGVQSAAAYALRRIDTPQARKALERPEK